ncbi:hypothetical protein Plhal710r2_c030g0113421 [Plasmopara halstedii]
MKHCNTLFYCIKVNSYYNAENASIKLMYAHYLIYIYLRYLRHLSHFSCLHSGQNRNIISFVYTKKTQDVVTHK